MKVCVCCIERRGLNMLKNYEKNEAISVWSGPLGKKIDLKSFDMFEKV